LGCTTNQSVPFGYLLHLLIQGLQGGLVFSGVFIAEDIDGIGHRGLGDTTLVEVQSLLEAF
jgi:hypothetical protein